MGTVTYPDERVINFLEKNFVPVRLDVTEESPNIKEWSHKMSQLWTPCLIVLDSDRREARRAYGYLPPNEFIAELKMGLGMISMLRGDYENAYTIFQGVLNNHPDSAVVPEALYWCGVTAYKRDGKAEKLVEHWKELKNRFPQSIWWTKASFIE
ncbi:MAG TPA: tetratricopeptide repeat protein [Fimbriimonadales bacterium]|nr:tetratricopeptide repeat protein [Fimbriimonadales bacterium]